jgi:hypothetical protein
VDDWIFALFHRTKNPQVIQSLSFRELRYWYDVHVKWAKAEDDYIAELEAKK